MELKDGIKKGVRFAAQVMGTTVASGSAAQYVDSVNSEIDLLNEAINNHPYRNSPNFQGYAFEDWSAGTLNVNAAAAGSSDRAKALGSNARNSVDIELKSGTNYSAKSYATGKQTAVQQAKFDRELGQGSYHGQERLVPTDQFGEAKQELHRRYLKDKNSRPEVAESYKDAEKHLTDKVKNKDGVESKTVERKELDKIAKEGKKGKFKAEEHGVDAESAIQTKFMIEQSLKNGCKTAAINMAIKTAPDIIKAIDYLCKNGEIDPEQLKQIGTKAFTSGAEGFIRGFVSSYLTIGCQVGKFGEGLMNVNPTYVAVMTNLLIGTVKDSIEVARGNMTPRDMGNNFVDATMSSLAYCIGGAIGQAFLPELPVLGYMVGALIGSTLCITYQVGKKKLISFCVDTGFTCFGLVEQNYELPEEVLKQLDIDTIEVPRVSVETIDIPTVELETTDTAQNNYETVEYVILKRGIIGTNSVGYVL